jgi:hypothetical protein
MDMLWFLTRNGETIAQYTTDQFKRAVAKGIVRPTDYVRRSDSSAFISAADFLPKPYRKSHTGVLNVLAAMLVLAGSVGGAIYGLGQFGPSLNAAIQDLGKVEGSAQTAVRREMLRAMLLSDAASSRFFQVLAEKDPAAFEELLTHFSQSMEGVPPNELIAKARDYMTKTIIEPRSRYLSDDDKIALLQLGREFGTQLATSDPKLCIAHALGKPYGDLRPHVTPELIAREQDLMIKMLEASPQEFELRPAAELQALNGKVAAELYKTHGDNLALLDLENVPDGKEAEACQMFGAYIDGVLSLPQDERVALVRAMVLDPGRLSGEDQQGQAPVEAPAAVNATPQVGSSDAPPAPMVQDQAGPSFPEGTAPAPPAPQEATPPGNAPAR